MNLKLPRTQTKILLGFVIVIYVIPFALLITGISRSLVLLPMLMSIPWNPVFSLFGVHATDTMVGLPLLLGWATLGVAALNTAIVYAALLFIAARTGSVGRHAPVPRDTPGRLKETAEGGKRPISITVICVLGFISVAYTFVVTVLPYFLPDLLPGRVWSPLYSGFYGLATLTSMLGLG